MATTTLSPTEIARLPHARKRHYGRWISTLIVTVQPSTQNLIERALASGENLKTVLTRFERR